MVPFIDLKRQHLQIGPEIEKAIEKVIESSAFTLGNQVETFEKAFATYCGTKEAVGVASGTDALYITLRALDIGAGDEVITAVNSFVATAEAIVLTGAKPVFVDVDETTYNINPALIESQITERTKAIIPVHLYGQPAEMTEVNKIARKYGLAVIEDACQAHGALYEGKRVGSLSDAACFSFYPSKNLGALGDGGIITTDNLELAEKVRWLRNHGEVRKNYHTVVGVCSRLAGLQAAVLNVKLNCLDKWNKQRQQKADLYNELLQQLDGFVQTPTTINDHVYHLYVVRVKKRDWVREKLAQIGIGTGIHYPIPIHLQPAFTYLGYQPKSFPVAERLSQEILSLPLFPEIQESEIKYVCQALLNIYQYLKVKEVA